MDVFAQMAQMIIKEQESVIGPIAVDQAKKVQGLQVVGPNRVEIKGDGKEVVTKLISQYEKFFGKASVEVCRDAIEPVRTSVPVNQLPDVLKN